MLELLDHELEEAFQRQEAQLELRVRLIFAPTGLKIHGRGTDVAEQLGLNGAQAFSLLERLVQDQYIRGKTERYSTGSMGRAVVYGLTSKGLAHIGRVPHPNEELLEALDGIAAAVEGLQSAQSEQKTLARKALGELKHFARGLPPEAASELVKQFFGGG
jgi:predicted ArsR family transcriptional regulator